MPRLEGFGFGACLQHLTHVVHDGHVKLSPPFVCALDEERQQQEARGECQVNIE